MIFFLMLRFLSSRMQTLAPLTHSGSGEDTGGSSVPFLEGLKVWPRFNNIKHLSPLQLEDRGESTASVTSLLLWEESILCRVKLFPNTLKFFQKKPHIVFILHNQNIFSIVLNGLCGPVEGSSDQHLLVHYCKLVVHVTQVLIMSNLNTCKKGKSAFTTTSTAFIHSNISALPQAGDHLLAANNFAVCLWFSGKGETCHLGRWWWLRRTVTNHNQLTERNKEHSGTGRDTDSPKGRTMADTQILLS